MFDSAVEGKVTQPTLREKLQSLRRRGGSIEDLSFYMVLRQRSKMMLIFEVKHAKKEETMKHALQASIDQITEKRYLEGIDEFETAVCYGIAFKGKKCVIQVYPTNK